MTDDAIIFYSWQSEHTKTKFHIENALKKAITELGTAPELQLTPLRFDKDTQGKVGSVNIPNTIRQKIDAAAVFVADVSIVDTGTHTNQDGETRDLVNQNVMYELGYATGKLGDESIVLVMNLDLGNEKKLPFDIAQNRVLGFSLEKDKSGAKLANDLKYVLELHLEHRAKIHSAISEVALKEQLITAIDSGKPTKRFAEKYFHDLFSRYINLYPGEIGPSTSLNDYGAQTLEAYAMSLGLTNELFDVLSTIVEYKNTQALLECYKKIELLSKKFDVVGNGHPLEASRDYYSLIVNEIVSITLGYIAKEKWWEVLPNLAEIKLKRARNYDKPLKMDRLYHFPQNVLNYYQEMKGKNYHIPASELIKERFVKNDGTIIETYIDGNVLFWAITGKPSWLVILAVSEYSDYEVSYIGEFRKRSFINILSTSASIVGDHNISDYREALWREAQYSPSGWSDGKIWQIFMREGIKTKDDLGAE